MWHFVEMSLNENEAVNFHVNDRLEFRIRKLLSVEKASLNVHSFCQMSVINWMLVFFYRSTRKWGFEAYKQMFIDLFRAELSRLMRHNISTVNWVLLIEASWCFLYRFSIDILVGCLRNDSERFANGWTTWCLRSAISQLEANDIGDFHVPSNTWEKLFNGRNSW